jgi:NAD(P) transhydrogenase subunit alpha
MSIEHLLLSTLQVSGAETAQSLSAFMTGFIVFVLSCFVGYHVIWNVTPALHTPLMAVTNAISGIIVVGALLVLGSDMGGAVETLGFVAALLASINVFGGFKVTQRMLAMFKKRTVKEKQTHA